jgi:oligopeptide/dipeptide ABC transporter ATP-binding protein
MRQRALLAMSLMGTPRLVIADEPTTALDVTVQAEVLRLLARLRAEFGTAVLLISHDIAALSQVCDRVVVMYGGTVVEVLPVSRLRDARHPYTRALVSAVPDLEQDRSLPLVAIPGAPPAPLPALDHCPFVDRCDSSIDTCRASRPTLVHHEALHSVACWNPHEARLEDVGS